MSKINESVAVMRLARLVQLAAENPTVRKQLAGNTVQRRKALRHVYGKGEVPTDLVKALGKLDWKNMDTVMTAMGNDPSVAN